MDSRQINKFLCIPSKEIIQPVVVGLHTLDERKNILSVSNIIIFDGLNWNKDTPDKHPNIMREKVSDNVQIFSTSDISSTVNTYINHDDTI